MSARKDLRTGNWFFRKWAKTPAGERVRLFGATDSAGQPFKRKGDAEDAEDAAVAALKNPPRAPVPIFADWFHGRFWQEWVLGGPRGANKASEQQSKRSIYEYHLKDFFGPLPLDKIDLALINSFRAQLRAKDPPPTEKRINNILSVLSKALNYAATVRVLDRAPIVGISKVERPEAEFYEFEQWAELHRAAETLDEKIACSLAGDHGLRVGEIRALRMKEDVDLKARTITVNQAVYQVTVDGKKLDVFDRPKGRTRRTIPMSKELHALLRHRLPVGYAVAGSKDGPSGKFMGIGESRWLMEHLAKRAGLGEVNPYGAWHILRHTFATHAALLGANPWTLNQWLGHKSMEETMLYVSLAKSHAREVPAAVLTAGEDVADLDRRLRMMLDARASISRAAVGQRRRKAGK